eukprot:304062-Chlamydomonas_euryale.AAC.21
MSTMLRSLHIPVAVSQVSIPSAPLVVMLGVTEICGYVATCGWLHAATGWLTFLQLFAPTGKAYPARKGRAMVRYSWDVHIPRHALGGGGPERSIDHNVVYNTASVWCCMCTALHLQYVVTQTHAGDGASGHTTDLLCTPTVTPSI